MDFVHLKTQTEFSISQGINRIPDLIQKAAQNSMGAVGMTDLNGLYGAVNFYKTARSSGVKPILGIDFTIQQDNEEHDGKGNTYQLTVIAKNDLGYRKLIELNSRSYVENKSKGIALVKEEWLADLDNVIILSGAKEGLIGQMLLADDLVGAKEVAQQMKDYFGDDFYIELQRDGTSTEDTYMDGAVAICAQLNIPPVATHPCLFTEREDFVAHEARYCIGSKQKLFSMSRERPFNKEMYFKTKEEMTELFSDLPQALENTVAIAKKCNLTLALDQPNLPIFPTPNGEDTDEYFSNVAKQGLEERLLEDFPDEIEREEKRPIYEARLQMEIDVIKGMKFPSYFLIVGDFITWAKNQDIPVGAGRGSGAGSLVAYSMKITDLDPLPYNLLFERFLNPERVSMPDFDIDFCQVRRNEVYEYVRNKYGHDAVCHIGTFGTMAAKAVVRDVGRTLDYSYDRVDGIAKMINIHPSNPMTLNQFLFGDDEKGILPDEKLLERYNSERDVKKLIDIGLTLEGITRQVGTHAAGVVISPTILTDFTPLHATADDVSTQFDKNDVETAGLVKFDFLSLKNLTTIKETVDLINIRKLEKGDSERFDLKKISLTDKEVYKNIFANGNTVGVFQFEGKGITDVLKKAVPESLEDVIAINALYRPGPKEIIPEWLESKKLPEEQRQYPHPKLREILKETYGYMIYQEQVMQCAQIIAGFSLGGADMLRRAIGKKKPEEMVKQRTVFTEGAAKNGVSEEKATELFDLIEKFCGYGFNKSHAAAYSYIAYQTAFLKEKYPTEFLTANLNSNIDGTNTDKIALLVEDSKRNKIKVLPPDINSSEYTFTVEKEGEIRFGLGALKGVGEKPIMSISQDRKKNGPFLDFYDFLERVGKGTVNKRTIEALIKSGSFDSINPNKAQLFEAIAEGLDYVTKYRAKQLDNNATLGKKLFEGEEAPVILTTKKKKEVKPAIRPTLPEVDPWDELTSARHEKSVMGFFFSSNPFNTYYAKQLDGFQAATTLAELLHSVDSSLASEKEQENATEEQASYGNTNEMPSEAFIGCMVEEIKPFKSNKGAHVTISDGTSTYTLTVFSDFLNDNKDWFKKDSFAAIRVKLQMKHNEKDDTEELSIIAQQGFNFEQTKKLLTNKIFVGSENNPDLVKKFEEICGNHIGTPEDKDAIAILCLPDDTGRRSKQTKKVFIKAEPKLYEELIQTFGNEWVKPLFKKEVDNIVFPELPFKKKNGNYNKNKPKKASFSN
jgi:DNA polymerase-3 subunit alpha